MKLRDIPDPVWYGLLAIAAAGGAWWLSKKAAGAVTDAVKGAGQAAYSAGNAVQDAIVPGPDSLGTWLYGLVHGDEERREGDWIDNGRQTTDPGAHLANRGLAKPDPKPKPSITGYDYGTAGLSGIPWDPNKNPLPDPFNLDKIKLY